MDAFNYLSVMASVVVGLGLTQLLAGIGNYVQIRRRVRFYWLHTVWVFMVIVLHLHMWWAFWVLRQVADWNYGTFVYVLIGPSTLVIASHILIPELVDGQIDVERHYYDTRVIFFGMLCATSIWALFLESVTGVRAFMVPFRLVQASGVVLLLTCAFSSRRRVHAVATTILAALILITILLTRFELGQIELKV